MNTTHIPASRNQEWGFWGTTDQHAEAAWPLAITAIAKATDVNPEGVRAFLDSRHGRHFADEVLHHHATGKALREAIDATIATWMGWRIGRVTARDFGIPKGLPYLTGFVVHCEITDELAA